MTLNNQQIQEDEQRIFIYSTDEENLYGLSRHYKGKWITAKIYRCYARKVHLNLPEIVGAIHSENMSLRNMKFGRQPSIRKRRQKKRQ